MKKKYEHNSRLFRIFFIFINLSLLIIMFITFIKKYVLEINYDFMIIIFFTLAGIFYFILFFILFKDLFNDNNLIGEYEIQRKNEI